MQSIFMERDEILAIKKNVQAKKGPWFSDRGAHEGEMWKKTAVRRLCKMLPMSVELVEFFVQEDDFYDKAREVAVETAELEPGAPATDINDLADRAAAAEQAEVLEPEPEVVEPVPAAESAATVHYGIPVPNSLSFEMFKDDQVPLGKKAPEKLQGKTFGEVRADTLLIPLWRMGVTKAQADKGSTRAQQFALTLHLMEQDAKKEDAGDSEGFFDA